MNIFLRFKFSIKIKKEKDKIIISYQKKEANFQAFKNKQVKGGPSEEGLHSNYKIRKEQSEHLNIVCQNLNSL